MSESTPKQEPPYGLRMPPGLKKRVKRAAAENNRSMNAEIVATLEEHYPDDKTDFDAALALVFSDGVSREAALSGEIVKIEKTPDGVKILPISGTWGSTPRHPRRVTPPEDRSEG